MIPWLIYISSAVVFGVQVVGLFIPRLMNNIDPQVEKEHPLKRIKDNMFFILFNFLHVFLIIGGEDSAIQYVFIFLQTLAFYRLASKARLYNSILSSLFTICSCIQYFLSTGHRYSISSFSLPNSYLGLPFAAKYGALIFMFLNAFCPIIFTYWWSITMVVKE